ncbi:BGTF surface domain-containing protein [Haladaptatus salinisoli]|uniref:BGTF surface domain-containing protein n=1 Tax=Haladaptatus salinisoli TaxID=2884876 RepID=UPI001D0A9A49|nr:BGTF surface domain-containing protein [Haladaptatus salinisoli]
MKSKTLATLAVLAVLASAVGAVTAQGNDAEVTIDRDGETVTVERATNQTISGETTLDPGTEVVVVASSPGTFYKTKQVNVTENGTFDATFDFERFDDGTEFEVVVKRDGVSLASVDGVVGEQATTTTASTTALSSSTTETTDTTTGTTETTSQNGQPGFGLGVALAALAGVALLARRA